MYLAKIVFFFLNSLCYWFLSCVLKSFCLFQRTFNLQLWGPCSGFVRVLMFAVFHCCARGKKGMELQLTRTPGTSALFAYRDCIWDVQMSHGTEDSGVELLLKIRTSPSASWLPEGVERSVWLRSPLWHDDVLLCRSGKVGRGRPRKMSLWELWYFPPWNQRPPTWT